MVKTSNINARHYVQSKVCFKGNNTFSKNEKGVYKVYSYGYHFPIYAFKDGKWYKNKDKYSVTTSKHQNQLNPLCECIDIDTESIKAL